VIVILSSLHHRSPVSLPEMKTSNLPQVFLTAHCAKGFPNIHQDCHSLVLSSLASIYQYTKHRIFSRPFLTLCAIQDSLATSISNPVDYPISSLPFTICQPPKNNKHRIHPSMTLSVTFPIWFFLASSGYLVPPTLLIVILSSFYCWSLSVRPVKSNPSPANSYLPNLAKSILICPARSHLPSPAKPQPRKNPSAKLSQQPSSKTSQKPSFKPSQKPSSRGFHTNLVNNHHPRLVRTHPPSQARHHHRNQARNPLVNQARLHLPRLVRNHPPSLTKIHLPTLARSLSRSLARPSFPPSHRPSSWHRQEKSAKHTSYPSLPHATSALHPISLMSTTGTLIHVYYTSSLPFTKYFLPMPTTHRVFID
jgi:hypothetical protein